MSIVGVVLAAGLSTRMGTTKALLDWQGVPLVVYQVRQLRAAGADEVAAVVGHDAHNVEAALAGAEATIIRNPEYREGRASSVRAAARWIEGSTTASDVGSVVLLNVDQPRRAALIEALLAAHNQLRGLITTPSFDGRGGHPIVLSGTLLPELAGAAEAEQGLHGVLRRHAAGRRLLEWTDPEVLLDLNDRAAYEAARSSWRR